MADFSAAIARVKICGGKALPIRDDQGNIEGLEARYDRIDRANGIPSMHDCELEMVDWDIESGQLRIQYAPEETA